MTLNDRQDYFGQTVNIASRVQGLAASRSIFATEAVVRHPRSLSVLETNGLEPYPSGHRCAALPTSSWFMKSRERHLSDPERGQHD